MTDHMHGCSCSECISAEDREACETCQGSVKDCACEHCKACGGNHPPRMACLLYAARMGFPGDYGRGDR